MGTSRKKNRGFTLVEVLVVIGIISVLISLLLPALGKARSQANMVKCRANLRQVGIMLTIYANNYRGWFFPPDMGADKPPDRRWPMVVFSPAVWNPPILLCPSDFEPALEHSYLLNDHLHLLKIRAFTRDLGGLTSAQVVLMGEKRTDYNDYYMNLHDYPTRVEPYRHGIALGSNYLFLDGHSESLQRAQSMAAIDPWDVPVATTTPTP